VITQIFLDWISGGIRVIIDAVPPLPAQFTAGIGSFQDAATTAGSAIANFGVVLPLSTFASIGAVWLALVAFWATVNLVRFIAYIFGR